MTKVQGKSHSERRAPLQFCEHPITITSDQGPCEIIAMVGEGSGLAYFKDGNQYAVTSLSTGKRVCDMEAIATLFNCIHMNNEAVIQRFLRHVSPLLDWTQSENEIKAQISAKFPSKKSLSTWLREAFQQACQEST